MRISGWHASVWTPHTDRPQRRECPRPLAGLTGLPPNRNPPVIQPDKQSIAGLFVERTGSVVFQPARFQTAPAPKPFQTGFCPAIGMPGPIPSKAKPIPFRAKSRV